MKPLLYTGIVDVHELLEPLINKIHFAVGLLLLDRAEAAQEVFQQVDVLAFVKFASKCLKHAVVVELAEVLVSWVLSIEVIEQLLELVQIPFDLVLLDY